MNRPCTNCGRIITVPDIPLPAGYTQKCTACGFANNVGGEDLDLLRPTAVAAAGLDDDSWSASFDSTMDFGTGEPAPVLNGNDAAMDDRIRELESRLRADFDRQINLSGGRSGQASNSSRPALGHFLVRTGEALVGTTNAAIFNKCRAVLTESGYRLEGANTLEKALALLRQNHYQVIVLDQQFLSGEAGRLLYQLLRETPLAIRRAQVVVLLTPGIASVESQVFFQWCMDLNIHPRDLDRMGLLLRQFIDYRESILAPLLVEA